MSTMKTFNVVEQSKAPLIKLTQIPHPFVDGGVGTPMFLDPSNIMLIARSYGGFNPTPGMNEEQKNEVINSHSQHTVIWFSTGGSALVMEEPDIIAILRERACNNPTGPRAVGGGE